MIYSFSLIHFVQLNNPLWSLMVFRQVALAVYSNTCTQFLDVYKVKTGKNSEFSSFLSYLLISFNTLNRIHCNYGITWGDIVFTESCCILCLWTVSSNHVTVTLHVFWICIRNGQIRNFLMHQFITEFLYLKQQRQRFSRSTAS
jgi:hypothetical protein